MQSVDIRQKFLDYFVHRDHTLVPGSSLVPANDPTLLFTNAGMVQFKDVFLGLEERPYTRACSVQKCMRVSGKHNDLDNVGPSPRHHTFFEMLGNFSFGDYFKRDAIHSAWDLLTNEFHMPIERLWITVHTDDHEAARLWEEVGVEKQRILRFGDKENFWTMGETGPCGSNSEIHYYQGADLNAQCPEGVNADDDYIELWNLVFMQYNRDIQGNLQPLPLPSVDTGMGLERLTMALQGVRSTYETDLFQPVLQRIIALLGKDRSHYREHYPVYHAIADHSRAMAFLITEDIRPGNGGQSYVLRRILRRAAYAGKTLGFEKPFLAQIVQVVIDLMGAVYPELLNKSDTIHEWITAEEVRFHRTLVTGMRYLEEAIEQMSTDNITQLQGDEAFKLHDTYGFPLDLTEKILAERGFTVDVAGYDQERLKQQQRSRAAVLRK